MTSRGELVAYAPTAEGGPVDSFRGSLQDYFDNDTFSDVSVICGDKQFKVHRLILSAHSKFFSKALTGPWKENSEGKITLEDDEPAVVEAMLHFMYHSDYDFVKGVSTMFFHAQVYGLADKYVVPSLKDCSLQKFRTAIESGWQLDDFPLAIMEAYGSTPGTDRGLRDSIVDVAILHANMLVKNKLFENALQETPAFAADMVNSLSSDNKRAEKTKCPNCKKIIPGVLPRGTYYCMHCGHHRSDWASFVVVE